MPYRLLLFALLAALAPAQTKTNFTGNWKLDVERSRLDPKVEVKSEAIRIDHAEPKLKIGMNVDNGHGAQEYTLDLKTDGTETRQTIDGKPCTASARWGYGTGERLEIETTCTDGSATVGTTRELKLSGTGGILTSVLAVKDAQGQTKSYEFFTKEN
jgi:hypothetical protein